MSAAFCRRRRIRFSDCDPAGIVFYPQYFVMFNGLVEDWIGDGLGIGYAGLVIERRIGLPTVHLEAEFRAISRLGDEVTLQLGVQRLGQRSVILALACVGDRPDDLRMSVRQTLVTTSLDNHRSVPVPQDLREAISSFQAQAPEPRG